MSGAMRRSSRLLSCDAHLPLLHRAHAGGVRILSRYRLPLIGIGLLLVGACAIAVALDGTSRTRIPVIDLRSDRSTEPVPLGTDAPTRHPGRGRPGGLPRRAASHGVRPQPAHRGPRRDRGARQHIPTRCSAGWRTPSRHNATSSTTPGTSCGRRSRSCAGTSSCSTTIPRSARRRRSHLRALQPQRRRPLALGGRRAGSRHGACHRRGAPRPADAGQPPRRRGDLHDRRAGRPAGGEPRVSRLRIAELTEARPALTHAATDDRRSGPRSYCTLRSRPSQ